MVSNVASLKEGPEFDSEDHFYIAEFYCLMLLEMGNVPFVL